jgi:deoxyribodipyrimidine photolyase-related protein
VFDHDLRELHGLITRAGVKTIGHVDAAHFPWPLDRKESLLLLSYFCEHLLHRFGTYQDALSPQSWSMYHARLSFSMNGKMLHPLEICEAAAEAWRNDPERISLSQVEGFVRQIIGWREYMRGVYWAQMPQFGERNFFGHTAALPAWFWTGRTRMACLRDAIQGSLTNAYAHHIQRLMVTGNFALLAGVHPDEVDRWYLGIYIDAIEWVEITNTRGMSQFADGGIVGTKPYVSSGSYINKMGHHCGTCYYDVKDRTGPRACPFNALYWHFHARNRDRFLSDEARPGMMVRMGMTYRTWDKMTASARQALLAKGDQLLKDVETL